MKTCPECKGKGCCDADYPSSNHYPCPECDGGGEVGEEGIDYWLCSECGEEFDEELESGICDECREELSNKE